MNAKQLEKLDIAKRAYGFGKELIAEYQRTEKTVPVEYAARLVTLADEIIGILTEDKTEPANQ